MSLTTPTPLNADAASTLAASSARCDSSTAVSKPKHLSICAAPAAARGQHAGHPQARKCGRVLHGGMLVSGPGHIRRAQPRVL